MAIPFSGIVTPVSVAFTGPDGKMHNATSAHVNYAEMCEIMKLIQVAIREGNDVEASELHHKLASLAEPAKQITLGGQGRVDVRDGVVYYLGEAVHNAITERILWGMREGFDMKPYLSFLDNLMDNPSKRAVDELYGFIEKHKMGITEDGHIIAYKRVRDDYKDIHSGTFDNSPGCVLEMPRNKVDDDKDRTCSYGFHFCAFDYLPHFGSGAGNRLVIVKVNPRDVVSIPADHNDAKARACRYEVIGEYEGDDKLNILGQRAVWSDSDWKPNDHDDDEDEDEEGWDHDSYDDDDDAYDDEYEDNENSFENVIDLHYVDQVTYTYNKDGSIKSAEVDFEDHTSHTITDPEDFDFLDNALRDQAARGVKARIKIINGPLRIGK